jgi:hypothetical protein
MSASPKKMNPLMRSSLEHIRDQFLPEYPRHVLFTTFTFVSQFFEANVLPLLVGDSVDDLRGASETRREINEDLNELKCLVVCDRSTGPEAKGDMRYGQLSVGLRAGRFHPKIMLMAGTLKDSLQQGLWLAVGSGNLSLSGWAVNREIVGMTQVSTQHAGALLPLIEWLRSQGDVFLEEANGEQVKEEGDVRGILDFMRDALSDRKQLAEHVPGMPTLHVSSPFSVGPILKALKGEHSWCEATIISPFWSAVDVLVKQLEVERCTFVPSLNADGRYRFPANVLSSGQACQRAFSRFRADGERYTHAKAILLTDRESRHVLCVGSANFTQAAMGKPEKKSMANIEIMLRYELESSRSPWEGVFDRLEEDKLTPPDSGESEENAPPLPPFDAALICDWKKREFRGYLTILGNDKISSVVLTVDGHQHVFDDGPIDYRQTICLGPFKGTLPVRTFYVRYLCATSEEKTFRGLVTQVNAEDDELGYHPRPRLKKVLEMLRALNPQVGEGRTYARLLLNRDGGDGEEEPADPSFDFFELFQGTWKLFEYYIKGTTSGESRNPYEKNAPYGVMTLHRAITAQPAITEEEKIGRYIQLKELQDVISRLNARTAYKAPDTLNTQIEEELSILRTYVGELLRRSASFLSMFGASSDERIDDFLNWFQREIVKTVRHEEGAMKVE